MVTKTFCDGCGAELSNYWKYYVRFSDWDDSNSSDKYEICEECNEEILELLTNKSDKRRIKNDTSL